MRTRVGAFAADGGDPAFGDRVHPRRLRRREYRLDPDRGEHRVEGGGELGVSVADQVCDVVPGILQAASKVPGQLGGPGSGWVSGDAEQVDLA